MMSRRRHLLPLQQVTLMTAAEIRSPRDHALFALALGAGMTATRIAPLVVGHITSDGVGIRPGVDLGGNPDRRAAANDNGLHVHLSTAVRAVLARYVASLKAQCLHFERPLLTVVDQRGAERCASCGLEAELLKLPLFLSRLREPLSVRRMRSLFVEYRDDLRLPPHFHFDSLKATFDAGHAIDLRELRAA